MSDKNDVLCLACFTARADDCGLAWDKDIEFFPVSLRSHLNEINAGKDAD